MKVNFFIILLFLLLQSCNTGNNSNQNAHQTEIVKSDNVNLLEGKDDVLLEGEDVFDNQKAIQMLKEFYTAYITEGIEGSGRESVQRSQQILKKYVTAGLLDKISNDTQLDYDPFVNAQDFFDNWLKTLKVTKDESQQYVFNVSFFSWEKDERPIEIKVLILKAGNEYMVGDILPRSSVNQSVEYDFDKSDGSNGPVNWGRYNYDNEHIVIEIGKENNYKIFEHGKLLDSGEYDIVSYNNVLYIQMKNNIEAIYYNDTLVIQNSGNAMNQYQHFKSVDAKYMYLTNR